MICLPVQDAAEGIQIGIRIVDARKIILRPRTGKHGPVLVQHVQIPLDGTAQIRQRLIRLPPVRGLHQRPRDVQHGQLVLLPVRGDEIRVLVVSLKIPLDIVEDPVPPYPARVDGVQGAGEENQQRRAARAKQENQTDMP